MTTASSSPASQSAQLRPAVSIPSSFKEVFLLICKLVHEANSAFAQHQPGHQPETCVSWDQAQDWQIRSTKMMVAKVLLALLRPDQYPLYGPHQIYEEWVKERLSSGWVYGDVTDRANKVHSDLVAYERLPWYTQAKDSMVLSIVAGMAPLFDKAVTQVDWTGGIGREFLLVESQTPTMAR